ncbi:uncharacterized protein LOC144928580 [Branchiostoma floridae x Branchiostoma belcheri]
MLKAGDKFSTWQEFTAVLNEYQAVNLVQLSKVCSKTVEARNRRLPEGAPKFPSSHVYAMAEFACIHGGKPRSRSTGIRPNQSSFKFGCPAKVYVSSDRKSGKLIVKTLRSDHNHSVSREIKDMYPPQRRLYGNTRKEACNLTALGVDVKVLREYIHERSGKLTTLKDLHNLRASLREGEVEADAVIRTLQDFMELDEENRVGLVLKDDNTLDSLFLQTAEMANIFAKYPEVVLIDSAYNTNNLNMPLFTICVMDGNGIGQPVAYVLLSDETQASLSRALRIFKESNAHHTHVKTVVMDKDPSEIAAVSEELPEAKVVICLFHAIRALHQAASKHVKDRDVFEQVIKLINTLAYSLDEKSYDDAYAELLMLEGASEFARYFSKNWHSVRRDWVKFWIDQHVHYGNRTNNRVEANHGKLKKLLRGKVTLSELISNILIFTRAKVAQTNVRVFNQKMKVPVGRSCPVETAYSEACTVHASQYISKQLARAKLGKYTVKTQDDGSFVVSVPGSDRYYIVNNTCSGCSCGYSKSMKLPCRHIFFARKKAALELFDLSLVAKRWLKDALPRPEMGVIPRPPSITCRTLAQPTRPVSRISKYKAALAISQELANVISTSGQEEYHNRVEQLKYMLNCYKANTAVATVPLVDSVEVPPEHDGVRSSAPETTTARPASHTGGSPTADGGRSSAPETTTARLASHTGGSPTADGGRSSAPETTTARPASHTGGSPTADGGRSSAPETTTARPASHTEETHAEHHQRRSSALQALKTMKLPVAVKVKGRPKGCRNSLNIRCKKMKTGDKKPTVAKASLLGESPTGNGVRSSAPETATARPASLTGESPTKRVLQISPDNVHDVVQSALRPTPANEKLVEGFDMWITRKDMHTLDGYNWLTDKVIDFYFKLIEERGKRQGNLKVFAFSIHFFNLLTRDGINEHTMKWAEKVDLFSMDLVLIPLHLPTKMHWVLMIIDMRTKSMSYYDSMGGDNEHAFNVLRDYLVAESRKKGSEMNLSEWTACYPKDPPRQQNGSDCGVFVCRYAEYVSRGATIDFSQEDMRVWRMRMVLEILMKDLLDNKMDLKTTRRNLEERIVGYIKTKQDAEQHLAGIYSGSIASTRHETFNHRRKAVRNKLEWQGTGYITSDDLHEELLQVLTQMHLRWETRNFIDTKYVALVLMPEAIVYGLHKVEAISLEEAEKQMDKGPERAPDEVWYKN